MKKERPTCSLRDRARLRLERLHADSYVEPEEIRRLRAGGNVVLSGPRGYVVLPPEGD